MKAMDTLPSFFHYPNASLRGADENDIPFLVKLINEAYSYQDEAKGSTRTNPEHLRKRMTKTDFYVIERANEIVGCIYLEPRELSLHFGLLTLIPRLRGKGIAQAVMTAIEAHAQHHNYPTIELDYMSLAPWLRPYYEKYGFIATGEIQEWGSIDLIRMKKQF